MGRFELTNAVISTRYANTSSLDSLATLLINLYSASALPMCVYNITVIIACCSSKSTPHFLKPFTSTDKHISFRSLVNFNKG